MNQSLPTGDVVRRDVQQFGLGPYDYSDGEDRDEGPVQDAEPFGAETLYASSRVPSDDGNPSARSDYYDKMVMAESELPGVGKAEQTVPNDLSALGNSSSGYVVDDTSGPSGHPISDVYEVPPRSASEGASMERRSWEKKMDEAMKITDEDSRKEAVASLYASMPGHPRSATDTSRVGDLAKAVVKAHGRKGLTRRHVTAVLDAEGAPQFLASDVVRCLKLRHSVYMADSPTDFPVADPPAKPRKAAAPDDLRASIASLREKIIGMEVTHLHRPEAASVLRRCAAAMSHVLVDLEKLEARHG